MLNEQQIKAAYELNGHALISASPGSGKTKTLIARAERQIERLPENKMLGLITYTNAAADEIQSRLTPSDHPIFIGTIHRFCLEFILRPFGWLYKWPRPRIINHEESLEFVEEQSGIDWGENPIDELNKIKRSLDGSLDRSVEWTLDVDIQVVAMEYFLFLNRKEVLDFNEILYRSYKIVSSYSFVSESLASRFYEILVDEFQDTNIFQYQIFLLIKNAGSVTFFMVGDERQRIYRFAGAIDSAFQLAKRDFPAEHETLTITYRSTDKIIQAYSALFEDHPIICNVSENRDLSIPVYFVETQKANHDEKLKSWVKCLVDAKFCESEIAILSTSWFDSLHASSILRGNYNVVGLGALPHSTRGIKNSTFELFRSICTFCQRATVRNLKTIKRSIELHSLENSLNIQEDELTVLQNEIIDLFQKIGRTNSVTTGFKEVEEIFNNIFKIAHPTFEQILSMIKPGEIDSWTMEKYLCALSGVDGITSNTIHQAKGLEYDAVILNSMNENKIPYQKLISRQPYTYTALDDCAKEDGRNLFYVAVSRAKKVLIILHNWKPSLFVNLIKAKCTNASK